MTLHSHFQPASLAPHTAPLQNLALRSGFEPAREYPCVSSMASRRPGPLHTTPVATRSVSDSIARCIICFEPCSRNRSPSGHSTSRSSCRRITVRLTLPPGFRPTSSCSASYQLTTCLGAQPRPRLDPPTGYDSIGCACRIHTPGHWSISKKL